MKENKKHLITIISQNLKKKNACTYVFKVVLHLVISLFYILNQIKLINLVLLNVVLYVNYVKSCIQSLLLIS